MLQEEIARLTGKLVFQVDNRPLATFEKKLGGVLSMLKELSSLANKKFTVKVALDSRSLRAQIDKATKTKITLTNVDISNEALHTQAKRIQDYLNRTTINLNNVKVDISKLVEQKRFVKTLLGQMSIDIPAKFNTTKFEAELKQELKGVAQRNPLKIKVELNNNNLAIKLRRALIEAQKRMGEMKLRVADPQVRLKVDKQHLVDEIKAAIASTEFRIRLGASRNDLGGGRGGSGGGGRSQVDRGLSSAMGFARGALPGLGAAFAVSQLNQINQQMQAQENAMTAVMGSQQAGSVQSEWVKNLSNQIGLDFRQIAPSFTKMLASGQTSGMSVESVQSIFQGVSEYGRVMGLDSEAMKGGMRAIEQMMNKGQVMSEELKGQLAERMPGAISAMAEAAGFGQGPDSVSKLFKAMEDGQVKSTAVLEKFAAILAQRAREGDALAKAMESTAAEQARMNNAFSDSVKAFAEGGFDAGMASFFKQMADSMERSEPLTRALGGAFEVLIKPVDAFIRLLGDFGEAWPKIASGLGISEKGLAAFSITALASVTPLGRLATVIAGVVLAVEDFVTWMKGGKSTFGDWIEETDGAKESVDRLESAWQTFKTSLTGTTEAVTTLLEKMGILSKTTSEVNFSPTFVSTLDKLSSILGALGNAIDAIGKLASGDISGIGDALTSMKDNLENYAKQNLMDFATMALRTQARMTIDNRPMGTQPGEGTTPATGVVDRSGTPTFDMGGFTFNISMDGVSDPEKFVNELQPHLENVFDSKMSKMIGTYRANTAER